uniref:Propionyl-CoA carboxylase beta chain, mitochondrial n=1 Tax=Lygus hesperus TaxID=30085 RepID=A0A0A9XD88_LYGHE
MLATEDGAHGDGVICGRGRIHNKPVALYAYDFSIQGGSLSEKNSKKIVHTMQTALRFNCPIISLMDSCGARISDSVDALVGYGNILRTNVELGGKVPQISIILGVAAGGASYSSALQDLVLMGRNNSYMFSTGPDVVATSVGEATSKDELGGPFVHGTQSGLVHLVCDTELQTLRAARCALHYLPQNSQRTPPCTVFVDKGLQTHLRTCIPVDMDEPYDVKPIIQDLVDQFSFFELSPTYATNIVTGFARVGGYSVGVVANQPCHLAGCLTSDAAIKASSFLQLCSRYNLPIITFVDVPGAIVGTEAEVHGCSRHIVQLLRSYVQASNVLKITVTLRKSYGGGHIAMASKQIGAQIHYAWPTAQFAIFSASCYARIMLRNEPIEVQQSKSLEYCERFLTPLLAARRGYIDDIIDPATTRTRLIQDLNFYYFDTQHHSS